MLVEKRRKAHESIGVGAAVLALVAAPMVGTTLSAASAAGPVTVLSADFEDGTANGWTQSGGPSLSYPQDTVLQVAGRAQTWDGITSPTVAVEAGVTYTFSARARLADGTAGTTSMRFQTGAPSYSWIGNTSDVSAAGWTTVRGTWTAPESKDEAFTFGADPLTGSAAPYTYLVDDLLITRPGAEVGTTVTVAAADFQTDGRGGWTQSGGPTLSEVSLGRHLRVTDRANDYDGIQSPATEFEAGVEYTVTARARLGAGTVGTAGLRFVTNPGFAWVANTTVDASGWTTVTGTWTPTATASHQLYVGTDALSSSAEPYTYDIDDIVVTRPAAPVEEPSPTAVVAADFDDSTLGDLRQSGDPTLGYVAEGDGQALSVTGRGATWHTVESATGVLEAGVEYTFSARLRLLDADADAVGRFTLYDGSYTPVGPAPLSTSAWTTVTGTYTVPSGVDASTVKFAIEAGTWGGSTPGFLVDDVQVTRAGGGTDPTDPTDPPADETVLASDFETDLTPWVARGGTVERTTTGARTGTGAMLVSGRTQNWHGAQTPIAPIMAEGGTYTVSAWVRLAPGQAADTLKMTVAELPEAWQEAAPAVAVTDAAWVQLTGTYTRAAGVTGGDLYVEAAGATTSFLVDDVTIVGPPAGGDDWEPDLDGFVPGGAVNPTTTPVTTARGVDGDAQRAALTFDDGPNGAHTTELLDFLAANDVQATFCVIGQNVTASGGAALLQRMVADGHTLCNHGTSYADMGSWTKAQVETDLKANLAIIRTALGDPEAQVPYFRAPNGSWGQTAPVAVALGMQPLAVTNTIADWETQDEATLTANLRTSMRDGEVVLVHDGGGDRAASVAAARTVIAERLAAGWEFTLPSGGADGGWVPSGSIDADFEDNTLQGWTGRNTGATDHTVEVVAPGHDSQYAARIADRDNQGDGLQHNVAGVFEAGATYDFSAWIRFESNPGDVTLSARAVTGGSESYPNLVTLSQMSTDWKQVSGSFTMPSYTTAAEVYFETAWAGGAAGNTSTFLVDDIAFEKRPDPVVQDLPSLQESIGVPFGVAVDSRETVRSAAQLLGRHFSQITPENSMKPEAWYSGRTFTPSADAQALMDHAAANDLRVYGHVLVWHAQTPAWFFQDDAGNPLPVNDASAEIVRERMRTHINSIAEYMADRYGPFGSPGNPLVAWDVANETISDSAEYADGMRRSDWYKYLGEEFLDSAFEYADEAFNGTYAAEGVDHPVTLFINDYNSELPGKQQRYYDLIERLLARGVPLDGVGHQMHVSLSLPVWHLGAALEKFSDLGLQQAVTELDVTTGVPLTEALLVEQGYYYRDAFRAFRQYEDQLFSVTVWGLYDTRSWRNANGAPLVFDEGMQAKPAYHGIMDAELPARVRSANAFAGDVVLDDDALEDVAWSQLPLHDVDGVAAFQTRWAPDHLSVYVEVADPYDTVELQVGEETFTVARDGSGDVDGVVADGSGGWAAVVHVPVTGTEGGTLELDLRVRGEGQVAGWNTPGTLGTLSLVEPLSTVEVVKAPSVPVVDGAVDELWAQAATVSTGKQVQGTGGATATVRTVWKGTTLYVLADVVDPTVSTSASAAEQQDSLEIFLDTGNVKNGPYRYDDTQIRINADGDVSFGTGDLPFQTARVESAAERTDTGYRVEAAIGLLESGGPGTFHGLDFQVNDATAGSRTAVRTWADPTGLGFQSTQRWGVAHLVPALTPPAEGAEPQLSLSLGSIKAGGTVTVELAGFTPGETVTIALGNAATAGGGAGGAGAAVVAPAGTTALGSVLVAGDGTASLTVTVPASTPPGTYRVVAAVAGEVLAEGALTVSAAAAAPAASGSTPARAGNLATTGAGLGLGLLALLTLVTGSVLVAARRRGHLAPEAGRTLRR